MCAMSRASEISNNVWLGPSPDVILHPSGSGAALMQNFGLLIETSDVANIPCRRLLEKVSQRLANKPARRLVFSFPSSGSILPTIEHNKEVDDFISAIRWIYYLANPKGSAEEVDSGGDRVMDSSRKDAVKILIHCPDGYTESSLLAVAYFMFAEGLPLHEAWLKLHTEKSRNFFAYPSDVTFLQIIQQRLLSESPVAHNMTLSRFAGPTWLERMDGSLPSRILPYMYLGNLTHANNPELLYALGIRRILSVGEPVSWTDSDIDEWGEQNLMFVDSVQDNGIDPLTHEFDRCLEFIGEWQFDLMLAKVA
jgi:dual specificity MAP kinase phosphatase